MSNDQVNGLAYHHAKASDEQNVNYLCDVNSLHSQGRLPVAVVLEAPYNDRARNSDLVILL